MRRAFFSLLRGENFGNLQVKLAADPKCAVPIRGTPCYRPLLQHAPDQGVASALDAWNWCVKRRWTTANASNCRSGA